MIVQGCTVKRAATTASAHLASLLGSQLPGAALASTPWRRAVEGYTKVERLTTAQEARLCIPTLSFIL